MLNMLIGLQKGKLLTGILVCSRPYIRGARPLFCIIFYNATQVIRIILEGFSYRTDSFLTLSFLQYLFPHYVFLVQDPSADKRLRFQKKSIF